jgi:hypothetical protein
MENKQLLISESRGDSNRCTPCRGKPDQHDTYASNTSPRMPNIRFLWVVPVRGNLSWVIDRVEQGHCSREKGLLTQSTTHQLTDPWVYNQFLSWANLEAIGAKLSIYRRQTTRLTRPISPACDRYVQYLLTGTNPSVLNWHRRGLPHRNLRITIALSPPFPSECSTGPPNWPRLVSILSGITHKFQGSSLKGPMSTTWSSDHSAIYRNLHLRLAIASDLSLAIGSTRVDWKVNLMQLLHQFHSYNLMYKQES